MRAGLGGILLIGVVAIAISPLRDLSVALQSHALPTRRHILVITIDALRPDYLSANGYDLPTSPVIDSLLRSGTNFTHVITTVPRTTPAVTSFFTGRYPQNHGVRKLMDHLGPNYAYLPALARERGYRTVAVVSNPILAPTRGLTRGFDTYDVADDARDAQRTTSAMLSALRNVRSDEPVFAWIHYIDPHVPYYPPPELARRFDSNYQGPYQLHFGEMPEDMGEGAFPADLPKEIAIYRNPLPERVNAHIRRLYAADIRNTDDAIGELLTGLRAQFGDDWLIVIASDHGESLGENNYFFEHGDYVSNAELRVPLAFVFPPGDPLAGSRTVSTWVSLVDVAPTMADLLDMRSADPSIPFDGRSLVPAFEGGDLSDRPVFAECGEPFFPAFVQRRVRFTVDGRLRTVILDDQKLVWTPGRPAADAYELYDLARDPLETHDLYDAMSGDTAVENLRAVLGDWYSSTVNPTSPQVQLTDADHQRLRALGYTN